ncbi:MAG TPA: tail protein X [Kofleriaceae bacterium]
MKLFAPDGMATPFRGLRPRDIGPATGVLEHIVTAGDRLDLLALQYYNDDRLWWRILDANPGLLFGVDLALSDLEGSTLIIPRVRE